MVYVGLGVLALGQAVCGVGRALGALFRVRLDEAKFFKLPSELCDVIANYCSLCVELFRVL